MTIEQIQWRLSGAVDEPPAPPTHVVVTDVYRAGLRRRRVRRWCSVAAVGVTVAGVAGGAVLVDQRLAAVPPAPGAREPAAPADRPGTGSGDAATAGQAPRTCAEVARAVETAVAASLPTIEWGEPELPPGQAAADCGRGGLFWITFNHQGRDGRLGFEGGTGFSERGCDPARHPVACAPFPGGEVGFLDSSEELAVLLSRERDGLYFFLGFSDPGGARPATTEELAAAARRVAGEVFG